MADFIEMDHAAMLRQIAELDKDLANLEKSVSGEIMDTVLHEAAEQLAERRTGSHTFRRSFERNPFPCEGTHSFPAY